MLLTNLSGWNWQASNLANPTTNPGTVVTPANGSKGAWTTLLNSAAVENDVWLVKLWVTNGNTSAAVRDILLDIGIDPNGGTAFSVLLPDLIVSQASNAVQCGISLYFPVRIPAGSSIGARAQSNSTSTVRVSITVYGRPMRPEYAWSASYVEGLGTITGNTGVSFTCGSSGAEGNWTTVGTLTRSAKFIVPTFGISNGTTTSLMYYIDIGASDGTTTAPIIENIPVFLPGTAEQTGWIAPVEAGAVDLPGGTELRIRGSCSGTAVSGWNARIIALGG